MGAEDPGGQAVEGLVAGLVPGPVGALLLHVAANAQHMIVRALQEGRDHGGQGRGVVGVVAVDHDVDVGLDVGEGPADHVALALALLTANDGTLATFLAESFPTSVRYSGFALSFNGANALLGGTTPFIVTWLIGVSGSSLAPAVYLTAVSAMAMVSILASRVLHSSDLTEP